ncbi:adenosine deaminase family protein [Luteimonas aquatica]|uniref:adenosine deaminase family protein n=1 Tax=Luteimonas aquatica TaxID=450364 RepID=UPI001F5938A6|nr:adenosine deaminase [Luteimonas aquatica]
MLLALLYLFAACADARGPDAEARTAAYFDRIVDSPARLRMFLQAMPKGGDLHNHLSGTVYAEDYLRWAAEQGLCIAIDRDWIARPPCEAPGRMPARDLAKDPARYARAVDALSMRGFERGVGSAEQAPHDRFFSTFGAFAAAYEGNKARAIAAAREAAADDNLGYVELMMMPDAVRRLLDASDGLGEEADPARLSAALAPLLPAAVAEARAELDRYDADLAARQACGTQAPQPACAVEARYLLTATRTRQPARVFAALLFGFALAQADPRCVGVNLAGPEHHPTAIRDYALHMRLLAFLRARYPAVPMSLHAGELAPGLVAPRDLRFHIREAVTVAGARRIGHGMDIAQETDAPDLLRRMAKARIAVEVNLSSNAAILGISGKAHPLALYRAAGVPVVLSTDDQGVLRSDMTREYLRAAIEQGLRYRDLKRLARDSLEYAFLPGTSLWRAQTGGPFAAACADARATPAAHCRRWLEANPKADMQWRLERALARFEAAMAGE